MKLSQTEYKIKKQLTDREIEPSAKLWDNIQNELDREGKSNSKGLWLKLSGIAALLCLCFLAYQGLQNTREITPTLVLDQKGTIEQPVEFETQTIDYVILPKYTKTNNKPSIIGKPKTPKTVTSNPVSNEALASQNSLEVEDEVETLLQQANEGLSKEEQERVLIAEVENLLDQAIENTQDTEQKDILKNMQARLLLAEAEADIELMKPPNLKDKIWEAIVSNYTDMKNSVVLN